MSTYLAGLDALASLAARRAVEPARSRAETIIGGDVLGAFDIGAEQRRMNALKPVTVRAARVLFNAGERVIEQARATADAKNLPGGTARDNVYWKLQWHGDQLAHLGDASAIYPSGDDLKRWAMQAFIEANAVEEGAQYIDRAWSDMWDQIGTTAAALPGGAISLVQDTRATVESISKWTVVGAVLLGGGLIYGAYKLLSGPAGQAVVRRYLP